MDMTAMNRVNGHIQPMLAMDRGTPGFPCLGLPKLDGWWCRAERGRRGVLLFTRSFEPVVLPHIAEALAGLMTDGQAWNGEIYRHGTTLEGIRHGITGRAEWLEFHAFDAVGAAPFRERHAGLKGGGPVSVVPCHAVGSAAAAQRLHDLYVGRGYEGLVLRDQHAPYMPGRRSRAMCKMKAFDDGEFVATDYRLAGDGSVVFPCRTADGETFGARMADARRALVDVEAGALVKVRHRGLTPRGIPREPVALGIRPACDL